MSAPVERPIIFSGPMVQAILEGRKTQTRRLIKPQPDLPADFDGGRADEAWAAGYVPVRCPYGVPSDRLWVRETWGYRGGLWSGLQPHQHEHVIHYRADDKRITYTRPFDPMRQDRDGLPRQVCKCKPEGPGRDEFDVRTDHAEELRRYWQSWRTPIFMPRWASRLTLVVTDVRVQRLQEISEEDARAEGIVREALPIDPDSFHPPGSYGFVTGLEPFPRGRIHVTPVEAFADGWDQLNGKRAPWASNPWVWAVTFEGAHVTRAPEER